jgi:hypothetical protein
MKTGNFLFSIIVLAEISEIAAEKKKPWSLLDRTWPPIEGISNASVYICTDKKCGPTT